MIDWQPLLAGSMEGSGIAVSGARVGDPVDALLPQDITQVIPSAWMKGPQRPKKAASGAEDDTLPDMTTPEAQLDAVRKQGGYIHAGGSAFQVVQGRIRSIWVRGPSLASLPFTQEADIERLLGPAKGLERTFGTVIHHYPERGFAVGWYARENRLEHILLGGDWTPPTFGARQVLREWLEAAHAGLAPSWEEPSDRASSLWVRHARVMALLGAFELGTPQDFASGNFLKDKPLSTYPLAAEVLHEARSKVEIDFPDSLCLLFEQILYYRTQAEKLLQHNSGVLVAGEPGVLSALWMTTEANEGVAAALKDIEAQLVELIEPSGKQVTERELIERWGWPEADLDARLADEF